MKKMLIAIAVSLSVAVPAYADGGHHHGGHHGGGYSRTDWFGPMLGGMIIGGVLVDAARPKQVYSQGPVIIQQPAPVIVQQYEVRPQCRYENAFSNSGQYLGQIQVCN
jgi:hypothetical protein